MEGQKGEGRLERQDLLTQLLGLWMHLEMSQTGPCNEEVEVVRMVVVKGGGGEGGVVKGGGGEDGGGEGGGGEGGVVKGGGKRS